MASWKRRLSEVQWYFVNLWNTTYCISVNLFPLVNYLNYTSTSCIFQKYWMFSDEIWRLFPDFALFTSWFSSKWKGNTFCTTAVCTKTIMIVTYEMPSFPNFSSPEILYYPKVEFVLGLHSAAIDDALCSHAMCGISCVCPGRNSLGTRTVSDTPSGLEEKDKKPWLSSSVWLNFKQLPMFLLFFSLSWLVYLLRKIIFYV